VTDHRSPNSDEQAENQAAPADLVLSEDELVVNKEVVETERTRLVKRVEVETVTRTFELRREVLEIERLESTHGEGDSEASQAEADDDADAVENSTFEAGVLAPGSFDEGTVEIVLMQEEALITTRLVPRERVRLAKQVVTETRAVDADLRSEEVELAQGADETDSD
jgi:stress response protein YsnF